MDMLRHINDEKCIFFPVYFFAQSTNLFLWLVG